MIEGQGSPQSYEQWKAKRDAEAAAKQQREGAAEARRAKIPSFSPSERPASPVHERTPGLTFEQKLRLARKKQQEGASQQSANQQTLDSSHRESRHHELREQIAQIDARIYEAEQAMKRLKQEGLSHDARGKDALIETLKSQRRRLQEELDQLN